MLRRPGGNRRLHAGTRFPGKQRSLVLLGGLAERRTFQSHACVARDISDTYPVAFVR
jgi:hypothetical protein